MASSRHAASPLRDRLLSNSPDPVKTQILRESGMGWADGSPKSSPNISPLRISKRDSPVRRAPQPEVARRNSSSFRHVRNNNLVSKSPFKSQIPTAATSTTRPFSSPARRVSGEKRPRPQSIHDQAEAENDRPFAYKRERRQSKTFQGLIQKEPVTKSPFRQHGEAAPSALAVPPTPSRIPVPATVPSPVRSSLVSKRMHGPRLSGTSRERREKPKVTFNETCDVVEFDREEEEDDSEDHYSDEADNTPEDPFFTQAQREPSPHHDSSYESIDLSDNSLLPNTPMPPELDPDTSITGIVDAMFAPADGTSTPPQHHGSSHTRTFEYTADYATDLDTDDGAPFGRSHHATRAAAFHAQQQNSHPPSVPQPHLGGGRPLPRPDIGLATTPPRPGAERLSSPPLGRTTHLERRHAATEEHDHDEEEARDMDHLPGSPSPTPSRVADIVEIGIPRFPLPSGGGAGAGPDPFALPRLRDEPLPEPDEDSSHDLGLRRGEAEELLAERLELGSPSQSQSSSPSRSQILGSGVRPRISREEVQRRMMRARSASPETDAVEEYRVERMDVAEQDGERQQENSRDEMINEGDSREEDEFREEREEEARYEAREREREQGHEEEREASASTEIGAVETAEKVALQTPILSFTVQPPQNARTQDVELGLRTPGLGLEFGSRFGSGGLDIPGLSGSVSSRMSGGETLRAAERLEPERMAVDMDMRSALDRLMDDVAGAGGASEGDDSVRTEDAEEHMPIDAAVHTHPITRAATDSALLEMGGVGAGLSRSVSIASSSSLLSLPPPVPPKDNIRSREALILEKRREMRRFDEGGYDDYPPSTDNQHLRVGRPSARRSMSAGDAEDLVNMRNKGQFGVGAGKADLLSDSIEQELSKFAGPHKRKYHIREREGLIYASSSETERISHMAKAGDIDAGRAWKTIRRPSDMNEYSAQIKEYRAQQNPGKAYGKVFVKVLGVKGMHLPLPAETTTVTCTLNNGIHFVTTPEFVLGRECRVEQEFELIEHSKLEFTLTLKIRRDPHIVSQFKSLMPMPVQAPPQPPPLVQQTSSRGGKRSFWSSSPKKSKDKVPVPSAPAPAPVQALLRLPENLARYLKPDGVLARSFIAFKDVAMRCDARLFESSYPLVGQRLELGGKSSTLQVGELVLQMFRLPPLPGVPQDQLPQSLDECLRGVRHINWHKVTYFQGTLTQNGGDCSTWRRRQFRLVGSSLIAFNDVTKKATATIDLKKAVAAEDDQEAWGAMSPSSALTARSNRHDEYDGLYGVERSFRLIFSDEQEILFFADTDDEKAKWLEVLRALVGRIPPHPLWGELLWQRQEELKRASRPGP